MENEIDAILSRLEKDKLTDQIISGARVKLEKVINELILSDFQKLVSILYRIDVNESKLKSMLNEYKEHDAAVIITDLIIERQLQKIKTRREFKQQDDNTDESEKW